MMGTFFTWMATALSLLIVDLVVPGVDIVTFPAALIAAVAIGLVNAAVKPTLSFLALPLNFVSLGTFSLVVNGICFWLASILVPGFGMHGILAFLLAPVVLSFANTFISKYFAERNLGQLSGSSSDLKTGA
ncbi:phage holin family protein [Coleofasciculus sp. H7-2]|uniref:phage holin family protein n=1 Tax=Coleofasciculus sp. H7-2 TaxID=3351545 RepID=UPI0036719D01